MDWGSRVLEITSSFAWATKQVDQQGMQRFGLPIKQPASTVDTALGYTCSDVAY
ncbi:predicted protein [Pyrenophora tritici-repentis Pt-1C-BFP]|uniref:Uncharacterized protein n=1 Tax=Pyrenophora tritici-repentis (strain Pt-1C-BFP) TaxID=426418 RepID=B2WBN8_PYRTR|nr:uncharacterized protein PTRG_07051 [Pyrenophora tritici-repentis Pt-1C-BFP]EDU49970.1 predicted protein [Pyrenophora tritici-repentis Pt-1C-BFP]